MKNYRNFIFLRDAVAVFHVITLSDGSHFACK